MGQMIRDVIPYLEHEDLLKMKRDLDNGGFHIRKLIEKQIKQNEHKHELICATCSGNIDPEKQRTYTLLFGPEEFKKKASFCAIDCLQYFLDRLKKLDQQKR